MRPETIQRWEQSLAERGGALELLRLPEALFALVVRARTELYDRGKLVSERVDAPVVSLGNLSVGGTGKTPAVAWAARELAARGLKPGIVSRGYGAPAHGEPNDEALVLARELPGVIHVQDRQRVRGARTLIERGCDAVVVDDGFQHRRLARDLDIVLIDATRPWGLPTLSPRVPPVCALLPRGLLREPPEALARADAVVVTRADQIGVTPLEVLCGRLSHLAPGRPLATAEHRLRGLRRLHGEERAPAEILRGKPVVLISGIGNPEAFERSVESLGAKLVAHRRFPDHHAYRETDLAGLERAGACLVTTTKDAVKLAALPAVIALDAWCLEVEFQLRSGAAALSALFDTLPDSSARRQRDSLRGGLAG